MNRLKFLDIGEICFDEEPASEVVQGALIATVEPDQFAIAEAMVAAYNATLEAK